MRRPSRDDGQEARGTYHNISTKWQIVQVYTNPFEFASCKAAKETYTMKVRKMMVIITMIIIIINEIFIQVETFHH